MKSTNRVIYNIIVFLPIIILISFGSVVTATPPEATIISPTDGSTIIKGDIVTLVGDGTDPEDGIIPEDKMTWVSDRDGPLGKGNNLKVQLGGGTHKITLIVIDSEGIESSAEITLTVN